MGDFTRLGCGLWSWAPWLALVEDDGHTPDYRARYLWIGLYTTPDARRTVPGLFPGSIALMAEAARMPGDDVLKGLDRLIEHELVEFDRESRVTRLTALPDALDGCDGGNTIRGWWGRFKTLPQCLVRDAHVKLLRWIVDETNKDPRKKKGIENREEAWAETFATVPAVPVRRRGVRRLSDQNETGTLVQPGLFDARSSASRSAPSGPDLRPTCDNISQRTLPEHSSSPLSSASANSLKDLDPGRVPPTLREGWDQDQDQVQVRSEIGRPDPERAEIENANRPRPALALVPAFTPEQLLHHLAVGSHYRGAVSVRETLRDALHATIRHLDQRGWGAAEALLAGSWLATSAGRSVISQISPGCPPDERLCVWASSPSDVVRAIQVAKDLAAAAEERRATLAELTASGGS